MKKLPKTNAMRLLDRAGIRYDVRQYPYDEDDLSGVKAAAALGLPPDQVYKTLVAHGDRSGHLVCCLPVHLTVDLKKLAQLSGNKRVELVHVSELLPLTGYLRGGCSPLAMKKIWPTFIDERALLQASVAVSAGQRGLQMVLRPQDLIAATSAVTGDVAADNNS